MVAMTAAAAVWLVSVSGHAPSFAGTVHVAVVATFMLAGLGLAASGAGGTLHRP
jgi:hypothetical protein